MLFKEIALEEVPLEIIPLELFSTSGAYEQRFLCQNYGTKIHNIFLLSDSETIRVIYR